MKNKEEISAINQGFRDTDLTELDEQNLKETNGGLVWYVAIGVGIAIAAGSEILRDWDNFKAGLSGGCEK